MQNMEMNLNGLKILAATEDSFDQRIETIFCAVCDGRNEQVVYQLETLQMRSCRGGHTLYFSANGRVLFAVEHHDHRTDWREAIDRARTEGMNPQRMAWQRGDDGQPLRPRIKGGRGKRGGSGWTSYADDEDDGY